MLLDLAIAIAIGGDCLADIGQVRSMPAIFGRVASDPTVSRLIDRLAVDVDRAERAIDAARAQTRRAVWNLAGADAPDHGTCPKEPLAVGTDATLLTAHSEKEQAAPTYKRGSGLSLVTWFWHSFWSAGINRHGGGDGRALRRRG